MRLGIDGLLKREAKTLRSRPLALITNDAALDGRGRSLRSILREDGADLRAFFAPEHGLSADLPPGEAFESRLTAEAAIPVYCAYEAERGGFSLDRLHGAELLLFDLPLVGSRYYTYLHVLERLLVFASTNGLPVWVADRPDPIRSDRVAGPLPDPALKSMVAAVDVPIQYGLTTGELARYIAGRLPGALDLTVFPMEGYRRSDWFDGLGLPWSPPSPNLRDFETAVLYPGTCLLEGVEVNEGRGSVGPFRRIGAPWVDSSKLSLRLAERAIEGVKWEEVEYVPTGENRFAGQRCMGLEFEVVDREGFLPLRFGMELLWALHEVGGDDFAWTPAKEGGYFVDRLVGTSRLRQVIDSGQDVSDLWMDFEDEARRFHEASKPHWLYREDEA